MHADRLGICTLVAAMTLMATAACSLWPPTRGAEAGSSGGAGGGGGGSSSATASGGSDSRGGNTVADTSGTGGGSGGASPAASSTGGDASGGTTGTGGDAAGGSSAQGGTAGASNTATNCALGPTFKWSSTDAMMDPVSDNSHTLVAIRDPTVVSYNKRFMLYATVVSSSGNATLEAVSFATWSAAGSATVYYMDNNPAFSGSRASPQVFYVAGQQKWYLLSQGGGPAYSTASDPTLSASWSRPTNFFSSTPSIVTQNSGSGPGWTDFWVICDSSNCHLFFANNNGVLFRSQTSLGSFPNGFAAPVIAMKATSANDIYGGVSVYRVKGSSKYLLLVEAVGSKGHYIRAFTGDKLDGTWSALADSESNPFAGAANTSFSGQAWTKDIAEGELVRDGSDETMPVNPCNLQYLYQGRNPYTTAAPPAYPWKLGLLTLN